jgi:hypothetical protein
MPAERTPPTPIHNGLHPQSASPASIPAVERQNSRTTSPGSKSKPPVRKADLLLRPRSPVPPGFEKTQIVKPVAGQEHSKARRIQHGHSGGSPRDNAETQGSSRSLWAQSKECVGGGSENREPVFERASMHALKPFSQVPGPNGLTSCELPQASGDTQPPRPRPEAPDREQSC